MSARPALDTAANSPVVYVVDDDLSMGRTVVDILALAGIAAESFASGASVPAPNGVDRPDLAVVDQRLPDTTGIALSARLKTQDPDLAVILLTGYASTDSAIAAVGLVDDYLTNLDEEYARLHPEVTPGRYVELSVSDTGAGMSPDVAARIFEPFFTTKPPGKGTGLGLATVHGVVTEAGGSLSVHSDQGAGATFRAFFPTANEQAPTATAPAPAFAPTGQGQTILVVEDEPAVLAVKARMLRRNKYSVLEAATPSQALSLAADHEINLLLTDLVMPQISGLELASRMQQLRPEAVVLFMSGYSQDALGPQRALDEGAALIHKPFTEKALLQMVSTII